MSCACLGCLEEAVQFVAKGGTYPTEPSTAPDSDLRMLKGERVTVPRGFPGTVRHSYYEGEDIRCFVAVDGGCTGWFRLADLEPA